MMPRSLRGMIIFVLVLFVLYIIMKIRADRKRRTLDRKNRFRLH